MDNKFSALEVEQMASPYPPESTPPLGTPLIVLSALALVAGAGGMAVSFLFIASDHYLDMLAGAVGLLAGAILVASGILSLALQSQSPSASQSAVHVAGCLVGILPPVTAVLALPVLYFGAFLVGIFLMPFVLFGCVIWAFVVSESVAGHLSALSGWSHGLVLRGIVLVLQLVGILASWPLFVCLLNLLDAMGYKIGWS